jgi:hypothetical protein
MAVKEIDVSDDEIESLMAELEEESAKIVESQAVAKAPAATVVEVEEPVKVEEVPVESVSEQLVDEEAPVKVKESVAEVVEETAASDELDEDVPKTASSGLQHYVDSSKFIKDIRVTEETLDSCMYEQSGLRAYYGTLAARAEAQHDRLKARFEVVEATLYDHHRKELVASGEKVTEKMVENAVKLDSRWFKAKNTVIEAGTIASINKQNVEALKDRRDMIIQLGADRRDEYKGAARVLEKQSERDDFRSRALSSAKREAA